MENQNIRTLQTHRSIYIFRAHAPETHGEAIESDLIRAMAHLGMFARLTTDDHT
jgi:hypothetical protein